MAHAYELIGEFIDGLTIVDTHEHRRTANVSVSASWRIILYRRGNDNFFRTRIKMSLGFFVTYKKSG